MKMFSGGGAETTRPRGEGRFAATRKKWGKFFSKYAYLFTQLGTFCAGVLFSSALVMDKLSPFGIALIGAVPKEYLLWCTTGVVAGYLVFHSIEVGLLYVLAALLTVALKWIFSGRAGAKAILWPGIASSAFGLAIARFSMSAAMGLTPEALALAAGDAMMSMGVCYFFSVTAHALGQGKNLRRFSSLQMASMLVCVSVGLLSLCSFTVFDLSIGRVLAVAFVITAAYLGKESVGTVAGVLMALAVSLASPEMLLFMGAYPLGGLVAGLFSRQNKALTALSFGICCTIVATFLPFENIAGSLFVEWFVGCVIFLLLPSRLLGALPIGGQDDSTIKSERVKQIVSYRLQSTAGSLQDISGKIKTLYTKLDALNDGDITQVYQTAADRTCKSCGLNSYCWQQNYNETADCLNKAMGKLDEKGSLSGSDIPTYFVKRCIKINPFIDEMNNCYGEYRQNQSVARKLSYIKNGVIGQMDSISKLLGSVSDQIATLEDVDMHSSRQLAALLGEMGFAPQDVMCTISPVKGAKVEIKLTGEVTDEQQRYISTELSDFCDRSFDLGLKKVIGEETHLTLNELPPMIMNFGTHQLAAGKHCGDSFEIFNGDEGYFYCVLSDGMGTGDYAAIDSNMTCNVVSTVLKSGFDIDGSVDLINSALAIKTGDETISTIDLMRFDCFTGEALFVKGGSPCTYVLRGGRVSRLGKPSLPIGILSSVSLDKSRIKLKVGDVVLMVSDGVVGEDEKFVTAQLALLADKEPEEIARAICELARHGGSNDDITAICFAVERGL